MTGSDTSAVVTQGTGADNSQRVVLQPDSSCGVATTVIMAVSEFLGIDPAAMRPRLYDHIDPDALNSLFEDAAEQTNPEVEFTLHDCRVVVRDRDTVRVTVSTPA